MTKIILKYMEDEENQLLNLDDFLVHFEEI